MKCPKCGNTDKFYAVVRAVVTVRCGEIAEVMEYEFMDNETVSCAACSYDGEPYEFLQPGVDL